MNFRNETQCIAGRLSNAVAPKSPQQAMPATAGTYITSCFLKPALELFNFALIVHYFFSLDRLWKSHQFGQAFISHWAKALSKKPRQNRRGFL